MELIGWLAIGAVALFGFVALASRLGNRAWTDEEYERERKGGTALGNALLATQAVFTSGAQHALEQRMVEEADEEESGAPPDPGSGEGSR